MPTTTALPRIYFTVVDEGGKAAPAVEYWAAHFDEALDNYEVLPLRRFVKLLGSGESLSELGGGAYETEVSGKRLYRLRG